MPQMQNFVVKGAQAVTEDLSFFRGLIVGCGEASALVVAHILKGAPLSPGDVTALINSAASAGKLNGAGFGQTVSDVQWDLSKYGIQTKVSGSFDINAIDAALQKGLPVEVGVSNGSALTGEPSGLRGHYVTIVGEKNGQFVVADPNTKESKSGGFVLDSTAQFWSASPFAVFLPSGSGPGTTNTGGNQVGSGSPNGGSPLDLTGITDAINNLGANIGTGITGAISKSFNGALNNVGISNIQDLGWRAVLIFIAVILLLIGVIAIVFDFLDKSNIEVAGTRV